MSENKMILGVSYNVFDGEELLRDSILAIRESVDFISVVYQKLSNYGEPCSDELIGILNELLEEKLIDHMELYSPIISRGPHGNETTKRQIGLNLSIRNGCTHHMSMDCDEFYVKEQFEQLKRVMLEGDYGASVAQMVTYYKEPKYRWDPKENYYVPIITKITPGLHYGIGRLGVVTDPTRTTNSTNVFVATREFIEMHHMSYIRKNIGRKMNNSSAKINFRGVQKMVDHYNNWTFPGVALMNGETGGYNNVVETEELFKLENFKRYVK